MGKIEFTKTSLHNHFGGKFADYSPGSPNPKPDFDMMLAKEKLDNASENGYQLLALTNHNCFWKTEYEELNQYIKDNRYDISLIPGAELDIVNIVSDKKHYLHVVFLVSPASNLDEFKNKISEFVTTNGEPALTIEQLTRLAYENKCILIPHGKKSKNRSALKNLPMFDNILSIKDFFPILIEDNTQAQRTILESKVRAHITSDDFEWLANAGSISTLDQGTDFSTVTEPTYIWGEPSFDSLFYCAIIGKDRVLRETDISEKSTYVKKIKIINKGGVLESGILTFSHGMNSIIGNSGSGKTLLLNLVKLKLTGSNLNNSISTTNADYSEMYKNVEVEIYDNNDQIINPREINVFEGENLYRQIVSTLTYDKDKLLKDLNATPSFEETEKFVIEFNQKLNKYITDRISINNGYVSIEESLVKNFASIDYLRSNKSVPGSIEYLIDPKIRTRQQELSRTLQSVDNDVATTKLSFNSLKQLLTKYELTGDEASLLNIRFKLLKKILIKRNELKGKSISVDDNLAIKTKLSSLVGEYNRTIGQRTKAVNESKQIVSDEVESIVNKFKEITILRNQLEVPSLEERTFLDSVKKDDEVIKLSNFKINKDILYDDIVEYFDSAIGGGQGKILKSEFSVSKGENKNLYPINLFDVESVKRLAEIFVAKGYTNSNVFRLIPNKYIKYDIMIKDLEGEYKLISSLSAGQLSKIYINLLIDSKLNAMENNAVILYDQPDNNLEKTFILETLGRKLADLKRTYQVIITTHEPLLVVNSDSNSIIRAENNSVAGVNKIKFDNLTMYDIGDKIAAIEKIAKLIDGSHAAIKKRNQIYGGFNL